MSPVKTELVGSEACVLDGSQSPSRATSTAESTGLGGSADDASLARHLCNLTQAVRGSALVQIHSNQGHVLVGTTPDDGHDMQDSKANPSANVCMRPQMVVVGPMIPGGKGVQ